MDSITASVASWHLLADDGRVLGGALLVLLALSGFRRTHQLAAALAVPLGLVAYRKIALFIPVPGALSTMDSVTFWSTGSYIYFGLLLLAYGGAMIALYRAGGRVSGDDLGGAAVFCGLLQLVASWFLLPLDGWAHLAMPFFTHIAAAKVLLVHPLLLKMAAAAVLLHLFLFVVGAGRAMGREINKLLILLCAIAGVSQFAMQPGRLDQVRTSLSLAESWFDDKQNGDVADFFGQWSAQAGFTSQCGINLVEGDLRNGCPDRAVLERISAGNRIEAPDLPSLGWLAVLFTIAAIAIERLWPRDRAPGPAAAGPNVAVGPWVPTTLSLTGPRFQPIWLLYGSVLGIGGFIAVWWGNALALGVAAGILGMAWLAAAFSVFPAVCLDEGAALRRFLVGRDMLGFRKPRRALRSALRRANEADDLICTLPPERLATVVGRDAALDARIRTRMGAAGRGDVRRATLLTRLDWACGGDASVQAAASSSLPSDLWPAAVAQLERSGNAAARLAALRCATLTRKTVLRMCGTDANREVRLAALALLGAIGAQEASTLAASQFEEIRAGAVRSGRLTSGQLIALAQDQSALVRQAAWEVVAGFLTPAQARGLSASPYPDVRCRAVQSGRLDRSRLLTLGRSDGEATVRAAALHALARLTDEEALMLSQSAFADARMLSLRSGALPVSRVKDLCVDGDSAIRQAAFEQVRAAITAADAARLIRNEHPDVRLRAASSGLLSRALLPVLIESDADRSVRQAAWLAFFQDATADDAERVARSSNREIRPAAARLPTVSRETRLRLCAADWQADVRQAAWEMIRDSLTPSEAQTLADSVYGDSRSRAIESGRLPRQSLAALCVTDTLPGLRRAARERLGSLSGAEEALTLARSPFSDCRLYAVQSDMLAVAHLQELAGDPDSGVRAAVRERLAAIQNLGRSI